MGPLDLVIIAVVAALGYGAVKLWRWLRGRGR